MDVAENVFDRNMGHGGTRPSGQYRATPSLRVFVIPPSLRNTSTRALREQEQCPIRTCQNTASYSGVNLFFLGPGRHKPEVRTRITTGRRGFRLQVGLRSGQS